MVKISTKKSNPQFSAHVDEFCRIITDALGDYKLTQDYLHMLELEGLNYNERAKVATRLSQCRQLRRESKDTVEILEPLISFLESDKGKNMINLLKETLGKTRKVEERMESRTYRYKVLSELKPDSE